MKRFFLIFISIFFLLSFFYAYKEIYFPLKSDNSQKVIFSIKKGEGLGEISDNLKNENLIKSSLIFQAYLLLRGEGSKIKAGRYELSLAMNIPKIAKKLISGETIKEKIVIIEGWNLYDIGNYLEKKGEVDSSDFVKYCQENKLEGYLFPDTYELNPESSVKEITSKMISNFEKKLSPDLRKKIKERKKTIPEIITMASLIEKEAKEFKDKKIISGILWKRLKYGIPLQVDATVNYITGKNSIKVSKEETKIDSPYNTYKYRGLPFGPICNPGIESIIAAIEPQESKYLYYLSTKEGKIIFSETLKEHNRAKAKYLR